MYELRKYGSIKAQVVMPRSAFVSAIRGVVGCGMNNGRPVMLTKGAWRKTVAYMPRPKMDVLVNSTCVGRLIGRRAKISEVIIPTVRVLFGLILESGAEHISMDLT